CDQCVITDYRHGCGFTLQCQCPQGSGLPRVGNVDKADLFCRTVCVNQGKAVCAGGNNFRCGGSIVCATLAALSANRKRRQSIEIEVPVYASGITKRLTRVDFVIVQYPIAVIVHPRLCPSAAFYARRAARRKWALPD